MRVCSLVALVGALGCSSRESSVPEPSITGSIATTSEVTGASATPSPPPLGPLEVRMVALRGGAFTMGTDAISPQKELDWARPEHAASVPPFQIDVTEVTVDAYRRCVEAGLCSPPTDLPHHPIWPTCSWYGANRGSHPVNCVTWEQADAYCRWVKKQLPTEEMWEFAARGPHGREFPWGRKVPNQTWGAPNDVYERLEGACRTPHHESDYDTCPVGSAPLGATPEGILDLAGNVSEWTSTPACGYEKGGKCFDGYRIARGGTNDWYSYPHRTWAAYRGSEQLGKANATIGFRCAKLDSP